MKKKTWLKFSLFFVTLLVVLGIVVVPIPYYIEQPGATINLKDLITVNQKKDEQPGSFSLTSVGIRQATVASALASKFSDFDELVSEKDLMGSASSEEYNQIQQYYMQSAQNNAAEQALKLAGMDYSMKYKGVYVMSVEKNSSFYGVIQIGDTVTGVDGKTFENSQAFMKYVQSQKVGQTMVVTYTHENESKTASGKLIQLPTTKKAGIGISLVDHTEIETSQAIEFHVENIGGPSAGLMFTLEIYQQLTGKDLRHGKIIAGTGTIDETGTIGRIGGIDKKVASASNEGVEIFFAPDDDITAAEKKVDPTIQSNYQEDKAAAKKLDTKMKIVPVKTLKDAVDYLNDLQD
ncbi:SepM family pheromone-processing serine protease [Enterococcus camelliae]|uniref:endopeptidase La n=1 Tax=Enterococcus camelliae TaxID=453959 RepID=A0ABW5THW6_9ENTE